MSVERQTLGGGGAPSTINPTLSVPNNTNLVYGQEFYFDVILTETVGKLPLGKNLTVTPKGTGLTIDIIYASLTTTGAEKAIRGQYYLKISNDESKITGDKVSLNISLGTDFNMDIIYNIKKIQFYTLQLIPDKQVIVIPKTFSEPKPSDIGDNYIRYTTQLLEDTGNPLEKKPLKNALVYLSSTPKDSINTNIIVTTDPNPADKSATIKTYTPTNIVADDRTFISLISDDHGKVSFRVYSNNKIAGGTTTEKPIILVLENIILGQESHAYTSENVYIITPRPQDSRHVLESVMIPSADGGLLNGGPDEPTFEVMIEPYDSPTPSDHILFFTKESDDGVPDISKLVLPIYDMQSTHNANYSFPIPYNVLPHNQWTEFFYVVARNGNARYSVGMQLKYLGGGSDLVPSDGVTRTYNKVEVYSSFADYKNDRTLSKPEEKNALLWEQAYTSRAELSNYINNGGYDAFLKITATNDTTDIIKKHPQVGDDVYINMYVRSGNRNFFRQLPKTTLLSTLDSVPAGNTTLCSTVIPIIHPKYSGISSYSEGSPAWVYFEYYTMDKTNTPTYSHYWRGMTDTSLPGVDDDS
ncbi:hypothetical protein Xvie_02671 [Xenorhabdus vietnamensis]|uniref:Uncharacterized protein n=2 Tax=Xenorhabdus TaxID=626 RepID=A0A1Y2SA83_9GAMM|nr:MULTISPECIES: hypothetical protein [Xenorhabdus]OTA15589.1 hypothetical protein Xvie_02671 [Xenorhabdus vietnamensis]SFN96732.1 hypothetical protein SAMN05421579_1385 [Xenorhabdus japonica]